MAGQSLWRPEAELQAFIASATSGPRQSASSEDLTLVPRMPAVEADPSRPRPRANDGYARHKWRSR
jgi:hypothetical protein